MAIEILDRWIMGNALRKHEDLSSDLLSHIEKPGTAVHTRNPSTEESRDKGILGIH